jgi:plasmid stabilization system protein ParE
MSVTVVLRPAAQAEFDEAFDWYEQQRAGLGPQFAASVQDTLDRLAVMPQVHSPVFKDLRRAGVRRFPYAIYYRIEATQVVVIAVFHMKRDPKIWQGRA